MQSRRTILATGVAIVLLFLVLVAWRASVWHAHGWTGLRFVAGLPEGVRIPPMLEGAMPPAGFIDLVLAGSPAERAGIRAHDRVVSIDGIPVSDLNAIQRHANLSRTGNVVVYELDGRRGARSVSLRTVSPLSLPSVGAGIVTGMVMMLAFLAIAFLVLWNRPKKHSARVFFWFCVSGTGWSAMSAFIDLEMVSADGLYPAFSRLPVFLFYLLGLALATAFEAALLHLTLVFPRELPLLQRRPGLVGWMYALPLTSALLPFAVIAVLLTRGTWLRVVVGVLLTGIVLLLLARLRGKVWHQHSVSLVLTVATFTLALISFTSLDAKPLTFALIVAGAVLLAIFTTLIVAVGYAIATLVALVMGYRASTAEQKRQLRWPLWGTGLAVTIALVISGLLITPGMQSPMMLVIAALARVVYILIPLSFAFAILKYRLMEIDVVIKKTVVYSIATGVVVAIFFVLVAGIGSYITATLRIRSQTLTVIATLAVVAVFVPLRNRVQKSVERRFFQRSYDASEALKLIQQEILSAPSIETVLPRIAEYVQQALQIRSVLLFTQRDDEPRFTHAASMGVARETIGGLAFDAASIARVEGVSDVGSLRLSDDERLQVKKMHVELVVPLVLRERTRGVMLVGSMLSGEFDEDDRAFLLDVAQQIAFALEKLTVTDEVRDFERALEIQRALLPKSLPRAQGVEIEALWKPARTVGGDYYDVLPLSPQILGLCIGDVAGKGMPAALLMANLQAAVKASANATLQPHELCSKVATVVNGTLTGGRFVTFFYALLDVDNGVLRYTNAGHNPPLLLRASGEVRKLEGGGPVFARLMSGSPYATFEERFVPGDTLILFTDGVTEARDRSEEEFGEARLVAIGQRGGTAASLVASITESVQAFCSGAAQDDLTLVVVRAT
jgi:serine phosphatase RsbU (regulator of sigma subunit)